MIKRIFMAALLIAALFVTTGCYYNGQIGSHQVGLKMDDGVTINDVVGAGRYTNLGWYAALKRIDASSKNLTWYDDDVWTKDGQRVIWSITVHYRRASDTDSVIKMWNKYNSASSSNDELSTLVTKKVAEPAKVISTTMTLDEMVGIAEGSDNNRTVLKNNIVSSLTKSLNDTGIELIDLSIDNISPYSREYAEKMQEKALAKLNAELAQQKTEQLGQQLLQEQAQTTIDVEIAERKNRVAEAEAKVYEKSKEAFELERLRLLQGVIGDTDKIYFVPDGADLSLFLGGQTNIPSVTNGQ